MRTLDLATSILIDSPITYMYMYMHATYVYHLAASFTIR